VYAADVPAKNSLNEVMHAAILTAMLFALTGVCANQASRLLGAGRANFFRLLVALVVLTLWVGLHKNAFFAGPGSWFFIAGAIGFGMGGWCMFQALRRVGSTLSLLTVECAATIFASTIGWLVLGASLSLRECGWIFLLLLGVVVGMTPGPIPQLSRRMIVKGCGLALLAGLLQAISFNLSRHGFNQLRDAGETLPFATASWQRLVGGAVVALLLFLFFGRRSKPQIINDSGAHVSVLPAPVWVGLNALFGPILGVTCMLWAISLVANPGLVQAVAATATLLSVPFAYLLEGARPKWTYYIGTLLALSASALLILG
jgi:drug/metabolite transporter (DMT)-like permease